MTRQLNHLSNVLLILILNANKLFAVNNCSSVIVKSNLRKLMRKKPEIILVTREQQCIGQNMNANSLIPSNDQSYDWTKQTTKLCGPDQCNPNQDRWGDWL